MEHREAVVESLLESHAPQEVLISDELYEQDQAKWSDLSRASACQWYRMPGSLLDRVTSVRTSSGLCGVYSRVQSSWSKVCEHTFLLIAWELQDPGNLGTLIRSVSGLTAGALIQVGGCSPWSAKVARASAGSLLRLPLCQIESSQAHDYLSKLVEERPVYSLMPRDGVQFISLNWREPLALVVGQESRGVPPSIQQMTKAVTIPMSGGAESLNAGVAGSLACYEWSRASHGVASK